MNGTILKEKLDSRKSAYSINLPEGELRYEVAESLGWAHARTFHCKSSWGDWSLGWEYEGRPGWLKLALGKQALSGEFCWEKQPVGRIAVNYAQVEWDIVLSCFNWSWKIMPAKPGYSGGTVIIRDAEGEIRAEIFGDGRPILNTVGTVKYAAEEMSKRFPHGGEKGLAGFLALIAIADQFAVPFLERAN